MDLMVANKLNQDKGFFKDRPYLPRRRRKYLVQKEIQTNQNEKKDQNLNFTNQISVQDEIRTDPPDVQSEKIRYKNADDIYE